MSNGNPALHDSLKQVSALVNDAFPNATTKNDETIFRILIPSAMNGDVNEIEIDTSDQRSIEIRASYGSSREEFLLIPAEAEGDVGNRLASFILKLMKVPSGSLMAKKRIRDVVDYRSEKGIY